MKSEIFKSSGLTKRFFLMFLGYSLAMTLFIITITAIIIYTKAPPADRHRFPPPRHEFEKDHERGHDEFRPDIDGKDRFDRPPEDHKFRKPGPPPDMIHDLVTALLIFALCAVILSFFAARLLSKYFLLPVSHLANATKKFSKQDFSFRIPVSRNDEIGMLAKDFNEMAERLEKYESMRKQWIADIAHELRTPISIMQAEVEAVQDSVWPLEMKTIDHLHSEIIYLAKTVNDLHLLSVAESKGLTLNLEKISVSDMLIDASLRFSEKIRSAGLELSMELPNSRNAIVIADAYLLRTVFNNLIENSLRYTDMPGKLFIKCYEENGQVGIVFDDSPPSVPEKYLDRIFDRLFRVDSSRSRKHGGSGLGLSTCKTHIESMGGTITGSASPLGGLRITIKMPVSAEKKK